MKRTTIGSISATFAICFTVYALYVTWFEADDYLVNWCLIINTLNIIYQFSTAIETPKTKKKTPQVIFNKNRVNL